MKQENKTKAELLKKLKALKEKNARLEKKLNQKTKPSAHQKDFNKIFGNAPISISIINKNGKTEYINKIFRHTFGYSLKDIPDSAQWFKKAYPNKKYREKIISTWDRATKYKKLVINEIRSFKVTCKNGNVKDIIFRLAKLDSERFILLLEDVTEIKKAETALKENEERFKGLFENATVGIYRTSPAGEILMANPALLKMLGYNSYKDITALVVAIGYVNIEDRIYFQRIMNKFGEIKGFECEWWKKNKTKIYVRESAKAIKNNKGEVLYYEGIVEDITDKKKVETELLKNELRYRTLFNLSPSGIMLSDSKGTMLTANPAFCNSLAYKPEEIIGKNVKVIAAPENRNEIKQNIHSLLEGKTLKHTVRDLTKDGTYRYMDLHETKIPLDESEYGILTVSNDITERKRFEEELIKAKEKAEKSDRLKTEFLAQISHEIRTPINSILSFTSYLHDEMKDSLFEDFNNIFEIINRAGLRITRTIDMILNMSEMQTGSYEPSPKKIDLYRTVIKPISAGFKRTAQVKKIKFAIENKTAEPTIIGDEYTLNQIFDNLINNAFKYTPSGKIKVTVGRNRKNKLYAKISDTGIGISEEFLKDIFEPFSQEEQGYTRKFEGNGLGLTLVKKYCDLNNASISVKSKKNIGTDFTVTFNN